MREGKDEEIEREKHLLYWVCEEPECNLGFERFEGDFFALSGRNSK